MLSFLRSLGRARPAKSLLPPGHRVYAVGDIHGCRDELDLLLDRIADDVAGHDGESHLVFLGDYLDRGPDSAGVVERLASRELPCDQHHFLRGNHEMVILDLLAGNQSVERGWLVYGGVQALESYGVSRSRIFSPSAKVGRLLSDHLPDHHRHFLESLRPSVQLGDYLFVHAGIRPGVPLEEQDPHDFAWIRKPFLDSDLDHGVVVVHGHTICRDPESRSNRIGVDTGCYSSGVLTAVVLEGAERRFLTS